MRLFDSKLQKRVVVRLLQVIVISGAIFTCIKNVPEYINSLKAENVNNEVSEYEELKAQPCDLSGRRKANSKVDIGYDSDYATRDYYAYTNGTKQLVYVEADEIILQNDNEENDGSDRYCSDEAKVKGTEASDLDEGHVIADSLGGVSNSYNITPQNSYLNQKGEQYQMEQFIRDNGGASNFKAYINYPNAFTFTPSSYDITFEINGISYDYSYNNADNRE